MNFKYTLLLLLIVLISCKQRPNQSATIDTLKQDTVVKVDTIAKQPVIINPDSVLKPFPEISYDPIYNYKTFVLLTGDFHGNEVPVKAEKLNWLGVFRSDSGYYVASAKIKVTLVKDEILDERGEKTGKRVETNNKDTTIVLISGNKLKPGKVDSVPVKSLLLPGEKQVFTFKGNTYTLSATGKKHYEKNPQFYSLINYRLFLSGMQNGKPIKQLLLAQPGFDGKEPEIFFAADLDGDDKPDFIIDTSNDYNVIITTLYLSAPAPDGQLLKIVGYHLITGC